MFWMLGGVGKSIQPRLEVPARPAKLEAGHQPHCGSALQGHDAAVAGSRGPARVGWAVLQSGGWAVGKSTLPGAQEELRRRNRQLGRPVRWEDGVSIAGPGQRGGGNGKASLPSLGLQLLGLILARSPPCLEIKSWTEILSVFKLESEGSLAKGGNAEEAFIAQTHPSL